MELGIVQNFIVFQIMIPEASKFSIEFIICDNQKVHFKIS